MDFFNFTEHWAHIYQPMQHTPGVKGKNKRFFLCDGFAGMADMMRTVDIKHSPCVCMESNAPMTYNTRNGWQYYDYTIYFCVRAATQQDGPSARDSKKEAEFHAKQFVAYIRSRIRDFQADSMMPDLEQVIFTPMGPMWDGWNMVQIQINVGDAINNCELNEEWIVEDSSTDDPEP